MHHFAALVLCGLLSACATMHGPQTITLSAGEVEQQIRADLGGVLQAFKGVELPDLPLMTLPADRLRQSEVAYEATGVSVGYFGLKIDITPR